MPLSHSCPRAARVAEWGVAQLLVGLCKSCTVFVVCSLFSFYYFIHIIIVMAAEHGSATGSDFAFLNPLKRSPLVEKSRISWQIQVFIREVNRKRPVTGAKIKIA